MDLLKAPKGIVIDAVLDGKVQIGEIPISRRKTIAKGVEAVTKQKIMEALKEEKKKKIPKKSKSKTKAHEKTSDSIRTIEKGEKKDVGEK